MFNGLGMLLMEPIPWLSVYLQDPISPEIGSREEKRGIIAG
jgi:hypothetical protein